MDLVKQGGYLGVSQQSMYPQAPGFIMSLLIKILRLRQYMLKSFMKVVSGKFRFENSFKTILLNLKQQWTMKVFLGSVTQTRKPFEPFSMQLDFVNTN